MTIITLTTDFCTSDGYVGALKGVILSLAPDVTLIDIGHEVPPQNVPHGAQVLATAVPFFPAGTIHVAVIDPGVGSARRGIALETPTAIFVGPDNGLFTPFLAQQTACVALTNPAAHRPSASDTFHGRDIFAPVAAHLANGMPLSELGPPVKDPQSLPEPRPRRLPDGRLRGEILYVDRFGNLVTNIKPADEIAKEPERIRVAIEGQSLPLLRTYADVSPGALLALIGSGGHLELAVRDGSAAERLALGVGATVEVRGVADALDDLASAGAG